MNGLLKLALEGAVASLEAHKGKPWDWCDTPEKAWTAALDVSIGVIKKVIKAAEASS